MLSNTNIHLKWETKITLDSLYERTDKQQTILFDGPNSQCYLYFANLAHLIAFRDRINAFLGDTRELSSDEDTLHTAFANDNDPV